MADYVIAGVCFNKQGVETAHAINKIISLWGESNTIKTEWVCSDGESYEGFEKLNGTVRHWVSERFDKADIFVFVSPPIMAVRCFGPYVTEQMHDPAVIAIDENRKFSIPLLSGRRGEAFELGELLEEKLGIKCVTADMDGDRSTFDIEEYAAQNDMILSNSDYAKEVNAAIDSGEKVGFNASFPIIGEIPKGLEWRERGPIGVYISPSYHNVYYDHALWLIPKVLVVSVVSDGSFNVKVFDKLLSKVLNKNNLYPESIAAVAVSEDLANNFALQAYCMEKEIKILKYNVFEIDAISEEEVKQSGILCEAAALYISKGQLICGAEKEENITCSIALKTYYVRF